MMLNLGSLLKEQLKLDTLINGNHQVNHKNTKQERFLALLVEIGELANTTRVFKYWSTKGKEEKPVILDEYADGLHFLLSLALVFNFKLTTYKLEPQEKTKKEITSLFLNLYANISQFKETEQEADFLTLLHSFLKIGSALRLTSTDISRGYMVKLGINYERQKSNY